MKSTNPLAWDGTNLCLRCFPKMIGGWMEEIVLVRRTVRHKWHIYQPHLSQTRCGRLWNSARRVRDVA